MLFRSPSDDDMGNSEVGHNAIGCGQVYSQGAKLVNESIASGAIYETDTWKKAVNLSDDNTLHLLGLLSDGNVHSNINHLLSLIDNAKKVIIIEMDDEELDKSFTGLVANKYVNMYNKPVILLQKSKRKTYTGSVRCPELVYDLEHF